MIGTANLKGDDDTTIVTDKEKARLLNDFFQSLFTEEPQGVLPEVSELAYEKPLTDMDIKTENVKKLLTNLKNGKAAGLDSIPTILLYETAEVLALPISIIFRKSLNEGRLPQMWKKAKITPIFFRKRE